MRASSGCAAFCVKFPLDAPYQRRYNVLTIPAAFVGRARQKSLELPSNRSLVGLVRPEIMWRLAPQLAGLAIGGGSVASPDALPTARRMNRDWSGSQPGTFSTVRGGDAVSISTDHTILLAALPNLRQALGGSTATSSPFHQNPDAVQFNVSCDNWSYLSRGITYARS